MAIIKDIFKYFSSDKHFAMRTAARKSIPKASGFSGETYLDQLVEQEYFAELQGEAGLNIYEKMRRSDGPVNLSLMAVKLPILMAKWRIEPVSEKRQDQKIAEFIEETLFHNSKDWRDTLEEILTFLDFGFSIFEPVFKVEDDAIMLDKLSFRPQRTITKWICDANGELTGVEQSLNIGGKFHKVIIPVEQLLIFSNKKEGKNWQGISILRTAYKHWSYKNRYENLSAISADRFALGVPVFTLPDNWTEEDKKLVKEFGKNYRSNSQAYLVLPPGAKAEILSIAGARANLDPDIKREETAITQNVLAGFLMLGTTKTGSWALASELKDFFLLSLQAVVKKIEGILNTYLLSKLIEWNYGEGIQPPAIKAEKILNIDLKEWAEAIGILAEKNLIQVDDILEQFVRNIAGLPEIDLKAREQQREEEEAAKEEARARLEQNLQNQDQQEDQEQQNQENQSSEDNQKSASICSHNHKTGESDPNEFHPHRELLEYEKNIDWKMLASKLDENSASAGKLILMVEKTMKGQILSSVDNLIPEKIEALKISDPINEGRLRKKAREIYDFGREQVRREIIGTSSKAAAKKRPIDLISIDDWVRLAVIKISSRLKSTTAEAVGSMSWNSLSDEKKKEFLVGRLDSLSDLVISQEGASLINSAFSFGRLDEAAELLDEGKIEEICDGSSILDEKVCDPCKNDIDGKKFQVGSEEYYDKMPPYKNCDGGRKCRCVFIYHGT